MLSVVRINEQLQRIQQHWQPLIVGAINDFHVKAVKVKGEFLWHHHDQEDELFLVVKGTLKMRHREVDGTERVVSIGPGEFVIVPHGMEHMPVAEEEVELLLIERAGTLNTGNVVNERTYVPTVAG
jgi:mannose-6-phosphate isomerase-like protein (cupin superfamily)